MAIFHSPLFSFTVAAKEWSWTFWTYVNIGDKVAFFVWNLRKSSSDMGCYIWNMVSRLQLILHEAWSSKTLTNFVFSHNKTEIQKTCCAQGKRGSRKKPFDIFHYKTEIQYTSFAWGKRGIGLFLQYLFIVFSIKIMESTRCAQGKRGIDLLILFDSTMFLYVTIFIY